MQALQKWGTLILRITDKIFYGWVIVASSLIIASTFFGVRLSFGVFFKSIQNEFDLSRATTSSVLSAYMLFCTVFTILSGWALDRYGPRLVVSIMGLFTGLSLLITGQINSLWQIFLSYSLLLAIGTGGNVPVIIAAVSKWFDKKRGLAVGIVSSGAGLGTLFMAPLAAYLISSLGWRMAYVVMGLLIWLVVISLAMLLRRDPKAIGLLPDGIKLNNSTVELKNKEKDYQLTGFSLRQALRTRSFWIMFFVYLLFAFCLTMILTHVVPYATDVGISPIEAATIISVIGGFQILSRVLIGRTSDLIGRKTPGIICAILGCSALIWLTQSQSLLMLYLFALAFGLAWGGTGVVMLTLAGDIFGSRSLGAIIGALEIGFSVGGAIGPALGGFIFDVTSSYAIAFSIGAVAMLMIALLIALTRHETVKGATQGGI
ncbi:MFS transporter [Chloroflexota bacterium]